MAGNRELHDRRGSLFQIGLVNKTLLGRAGKVSTC